MAEGGRRAEDQPAVREMSLSCMLCPGSAPMVIRCDKPGKRLFFVSCPCGAHYHINVRMPMDKMEYMGRRAS